MGFVCVYVVSNGEGGIRTPVEFPQNAFRVRHHQPLGHLSKTNCLTCTPKRTLILAFGIITYPGPTPILRRFWKIVGWVEERSLLAVG